MVSCMQYIRGRYTFRLKMWLLDVTLPVLLVFYVSVETIRRLSVVDHVIRLSETTLAFSLRYAWP